MKLYYFHTYGRGESIKLLLNHAGVEYEFIGVTGDSWKEFKADNDKCPFGQVPVLEKDGKFYAQGKAILRYLGGLYGYYPEDIELRFQADAFVDLTFDFILPIVMNHFGSGTAEEK